MIQKSRIINFLIINSYKKRRYRDFMCGRYAFYFPPEDLRKRLGIGNLLDISPRYNCGPMQSLPVIVKNRIGLARWGFRPEWSKHDDPSVAVGMINARSETVSQKPAYRESWVKKRRCLIPASGFYEWKKDEHTGVNQPHYIQRRDGDVLFFAGLWSKVDDQVSFTILTKAADENLQHLHSRSPVMVAENSARRWFEEDHDVAFTLVQKSTTRDLMFYPVERSVGNVANDHEGLIVRLDDFQKKTPPKQGALL